MMESVSSLESIEKSLKSLVPKSPSGRNNTAGLNQRTPTPKLLRRTFELQNSSIRSSLSSIPTLDTIGGFSSDSFFLSPTTPRSSNILLVDASSLESPLKSFKSLGLKSPSGRNNTAGLNQRSQKPKLSRRMFEQQNTSIRSSLSSIPTLSTIGGFSSDSFFLSPTTPRSSTILLFDAYSTLKDESRSSLSSIPTLATISGFSSDSFLLSPTTLPSITCTIRLVDAYNTTKDESKFPKSEVLDELSPEYFIEDHHIHGEDRWSNGCDE
jgi:hypothetical protein